MADKHIYIVFSSTKNSMGRFIRFMTGNAYNHMSVSLDPKLATMWSFARHHKCTPFYGGFVKESCLRYQGDFEATVKICSVELTDEQFILAKDMLEDMDRCRHRYIYNTLSAIATPLRRKIKIENAFTCVEFAAKIMSNLNLEGICDDNFYTIRQLEHSLADCVIYEGRFPEWAECADWGSDLYIARSGFLSGSKKTVSNHLNLVRRFFRAS